MNTTLSPRREVTDEVITLANTLNEELGLGVELEEMKNPHLADIVFVREVLKANLKLIGDEDEHTD